MKPLSWDILVTIAFKIILLVLLWWFCVRGMHPVLTNSQDWLLGTKDHPKLIT
ncbi:MAG: cytochrome oxidase putative small subunit CydP [Legionellales bacterium]